MPKFLFKFGLAFALLCNASMASDPRLSLQDVQQIMAQGNSFLAAFTNPSNTSTNRTTSNGLGQ